MILNKKLFFIYFLLSFNQIALAQQINKPTTDSMETKQLDEVIVTATRTIRQLSSLPLPVQLIDSKDIARSNTMRLNDILNEQTGLITVPDFGGGEGIQLQGMDSQYALILIDGVPLIGRSAGTLDISRVAVGNIRQIEIVKGASSSLYGSEALGGVINIITENPKPGFLGEINYRYGSFNTHDANFNARYKKNNIGISAFVNRYSSDGYDLDNSDDLNTVDPFVNYTLSTKLNYELSEKTNVFLSGRYFTQDQDYIASEDTEGEANIREWNTHLKIDHEYNDTWNSYFECYVTEYKADEYLNDSDGLLYSESDFDQFLLRPEIRGSYKPNQKNTIIGGLGMSHETLKRTDFSENPEFNSPYFYVQYDMNPNGKMNVILGARFDNHNKYKSQFSPKIAIRYALSDRFAIKGSVGYGFKAPDFRQLYFDFTNTSVGYTVLGYNAVKTALPQMEDEGQIERIVVPLSEFESNLSPENSLSFNFGVTYRPITGLKLDVNLFRNNIKDLIDTRMIAIKTNGQSVFSYYNVNRVYTQGLEFNTTWKPINTFKISGGYQLLFAKDKDAEEAFKNGQVYARLTSSSPSFQLKKNDYYGLYNRSMHMANIKVFYTFSKQKLDANLRGTYRSKYGLYDTNGNNYLDDYDTFVKGYTIWDIAINKALFKNHRLGVGIDNLFDFTDAQNITNIPGRIFYAKLNIQF